MSLIKIALSPFHVTVLFLSLREKCPLSEFFWSVFSRIWTEYEKIQTKKTPNTGTFYAVYTS